MKTKSAESKTLPNQKSKTAVRGKYSSRLAQGTNVVILDPALLPFFPDSVSVNKALRAFLEIKASLDATAVSPRSLKKLQATPPMPEPAFDPRVGARVRSRTAA